MLKTTCSVLAGKTSFLRLVKALQQVSVVPGALEAMDVDCNLEVRLSKRVHKHKYDTHKTHATL